MPILHPANKVFVLIFLVGQLMTFSADYINHLFDIEAEVIEMLDSEDRESDEKEDSQEEDGKLKVDMNKQGLAMNTFWLSSPAFRTSHNIVHREINTPPPRVLH